MRPEAEAASEREVEEMYQGRWACARADGWASGRAMVVERCGHLPAHGAARILPPRARVRRGARAERRAEAAVRLESFEACGGRRGARGGVHAQRAHMCTFGRARGWVGWSRRREPWVGRWPQGRGGAAGASRQRVQRAPKRRSVGWFGVEPAAARIKYDSIAVRCAYSESWSSSCSRPARSRRDRGEIEARSRRDPAARGRRWGGAARGGGPRSSRLQRRWPRERRRSWRGT